MCGIVAGLHIGARKDEPVNQFIIEQYEDQYSRGQRGFGIIRINQDKTIEVDRATEPTKAMLDLYMKPSTMMIFHHRTPTSSENWMNQTHPIRVEHGSLAHNYLLIHNGVVRNDDEKREDHLNLGFTYTTDYVDDWGSTQRQKFNDSEAVAIEVARFIEEQSDIIDIEGSAAFIALQCDKQWNAERIFFGRNDSNPLNMAKTRTHMYLSSEGPGNEVTPFMLYSAEIGDQTLKLTKRPFKMAKEKPIQSTMGYTYTEYPKKDSYTTRMEKITNETRLKSEDNDKKPKNKYFKDYDDVMESSYPYDIEPPDAPEYEEIVTTVGMFFEEINYNSIPDVEWYVGEIRKQLESAMRYQEDTLIKEAGKVPELPAPNGHAI